MLHADSIAESHETYKCILGKMKNFLRVNILGLLFIWSFYDITSSEAYLIEQSNHLGNPPLMGR
jgi:hypothetical protein